MFEMYLIALAVIALVCIVLEEVIHVNKAKTTLFLGCLAWISLFIHAGNHDNQHLVSEQLDENLLEIASLWLFLMSTMTFVAYLNAKGVVQNFVRSIFPKRLSVRSLLLRVAIFSLLLSSICDNVTATLVSLGLIQVFELDRKTKLKMATLVVFAVNSGGVALITGDVTTLMIFLGGHVSMSQLLTLMLPSATGVLVLAAIFAIKLEGELVLQPVEMRYERVDIWIAVIFFTTIIATMLMNVLFGIPPVLTFLTGLSLMFLVGRTVSSDMEQTRILEYIRQVEYDTLLFFLGILLLVGMLKEIGTLEVLAQVYGNYSPEVSNFFAGVASALLDNVPLTAALLKADPVLSTTQWLALTYAVGVGGSLLAIGSAAGILAMSKIEELTFVSYLRYVPALIVAYGVGYALTLLLATIIH
ncbi:sodium:proton antiporter NhaD [Pseudomaricurvus sp. HS19]|uniref:sodium:proton antiporter NhaD n=1 Tax=Pseudomaricurvus sp. HS19 TaxID=2692626 RepID=UPI00136893C3|nr:sodium:proton antiporter NhaD [Pseudomaricurvus sp. HS19]MYM62151.1 sodium:proton antiporter [Pseudomaricurvus sp. HS19]